MSPSIVCNFPCTDCHMICGEHHCMSGKAAYIGPTKCGSCEMLALVALGLRVCVRYPTSKSTSPSATIAHCLATHVLFTDTLRFLCGSIRLAPRLSFSVALLVEDISIKQLELVLHLRNTCDGRPGIATMLFRPLVHREISAEDSPQSHPAFSCPLAVLG